tara:strand:+ start:121 stop:339 length:219 start_codon:yes stop_codon:yes gene_type:complete
MSNDDRKKKAHRKWQQPKDKKKWLEDLVEAGESVVKGYERYLLDEINYEELAKIMVILRKLLPMNIDKKYDD